MSLTAQQPYNNVVRTALQALSAVLGGTNSLHTNSLDEALALPTAEAATLALRTQQIIAHESGVANVVDPLGGSYFLERLTLDMEEGAYKYFDTIDRMGGMVAAVEQGFPQREIAESAYRFQQVGRGAGEAHRRRQRLRREPTSRRCRFSTSTSRRPKRRWPGSTTSSGARDPDRVARSLAALQDAARGTGNTMVPLLECVRAYATVGEMCDALRTVWGEYEEVPSI